MWQVISDRCTIEEIAMVRARVRDAEALLTQIPLTFPLYTRHDHVHAQNVLALMEKLLGAAGLARLTGLEAALLVLSAYFHDVGMVATRAEISAIPADPEFQPFLDAHPKYATAGLLSDGGPSTDLVESFLRWQHADRVQVRLNEFAAGSFDWGRVPLDQILVQLSRSHNADTATLFSLPTDFLARADLRMCAVLLRLADILDFDHSRSPEILYDHLRLRSGDTSREHVSDGEWKKHLDSNGFQWPMKAPADGYPLYFAAGPQRPATEHELRAFLDVIDAEVVASRRVLRACDERWRDLPLPGPIDRSGIQSRGYKYGEFRFTLDRDALLQLFMGDRLYENDSVFVRELLQNAIDATRLRQLEEGRERDDSELKLSIDLWVDEQGAQWVSFSDNGTGMSESAIKRYLLTVGASYYNSPEFKARSAKFAQNGRGKIVPISRFGIGLLSCFMVGDRVEISTLQSDGLSRANEPVRLSMGELDGYFVLQSGNMPASPLPSRSGAIPGYRRRPGTTVAVSLKPSADIDLARLELHLRSLLFDLPIMVEINGAAFEDEVGAFMRQGAPEITESLVASSKSSRGSDLQGLSLADKEISVISLNLTEASSHPHLRGQIVLFQVDAAARSIRMDATIAHLAEGYQLGATSMALLESAFRKRTSLTIDLEKAVLTYSVSVEEAQRMYGLASVLEEAKSGGGYLTSTARLDPESKASLADLAQVANFESEDGGPPGRKKDAYATSLTEEGKRLLSCVKQTGLDDRSYGRSTIRLPSATLSWKLSALGQQYLSAIAANSTSWCGHNGIALPVEGGRLSYTFSGKWEDPKRTWLFMGYLSLSDELRPEVNVARSDVLQFDFQTLAALRLAVRRACTSRFDHLTAKRAMSELREYPLISRDQQSATISQNYESSRHPVSYRSALEAIKASGEDWRTEALFYDRHKLVNLSRVSELVAVNHFDVTASFDRNRQYRDAEATIAWTLIQEEFDTVERGGHIYATGKRSASLPRVFDEFPPLTFSRHEDVAEFYSSGAMSLNWSHPLGAWIAENGHRLLELDGVIFERLKAALLSLADGNDRDPRRMKACDVALAQIGAKVQEIPAPPAVVWPTD